MGRGNKKRKKDAQKVLRTKNRKGFALCRTFKIFVFPVEPQSPNGKNINMVSADSRKSAQSAEKRAFCVKSAQKAQFCTLFGDLSGIDHFL